MALNSNSPANGEKRGICTRRKLGRSRKIGIRNLKTRALFVGRVLQSKVFV